MFGKPLFLVPLICLALCQDAGDDQAKKDLALLQGTWVMHALEINGKDVPGNKFQDTLLIVNQDEYRTKVKNTLLPGLRLKLDPSKNPKAVDMIQTDADGSQKVIKGIYQIKDDTLKICRGLTAAQERPGQFATWPDTNYFVVTWKKQK